LKRLEGVGRFFEIYLVVDEERLGFREVWGSDRNI
jgi:hypothetical protein